MAIIRRFPQPIPQPAHHTAPGDPNESVAESRSAARRHDRDSRLNHETTATKTLLQCSPDLAACLFHMDGPSAHVCKIYQSLVETCDVVHTGKKLSRGQGTSRLKFVNQIIPHRQPQLIPERNADLATSGGATARAAAAPIAESADAPPSVSSYREKTSYQAFSGVFVKAPHGTVRLWLRRQVLEKQFGRNQPSR